jgi:putative ABC transport system substrate-binding protein
MNRRALIALSAGAVFAMSPVGRAQKAMPLIGFLSIASQEAFAPFVAAFEEGLREAGFIRGENVQVEYRWAEGHAERLRALASELVDRKVDVILASGGTPSARAAKAATSTIPVVFPAVSDPVGAGLVASLARPGGNLTGFSIMVAELMPKRIELLSELVPGINSIALLWNPKSEIIESEIQAVEQAGRVKGLEIRVFQATTEPEIDTGFASIAELHLGGVLVGDDAFFTNRREQIVNLAARYHLPVIYQFRDFPVAGGLMSYGVSLTSAYRKSAVLVSKILKGANPADLPVEQPPFLELVLNLKTAKALGLDVPQALIVRADEIIE